MIYYRQPTHTHRALASQPLNLSVRVDLVVLEDGHLDLFALMLNLLGSVIRLLLPLLRTTTQTTNRPSLSYHRASLAPIATNRSTRWRVDSFWML